MTTIREEPPWDDLDPGICDAVRFLWEAGFQPTDSGDGRSKIGTMPEALSFPHVFLVSAPETMVEDARSIHGLPWEIVGGLGVPTSVEASFSPGDGVAVILVFWPSPPEESVPVQEVSSEVEVLESEHGGLLWVRPDGKLLVERGEGPCSIGAAPTGSGVRFGVEVHGGLATFVLPDSEVQRLLDHLSPR